MMENTWKDIETTSEFIDADVVLLFWSLPDEAPTHEFIRKWSVSKTIVLPRVISSTEMELRVYDPSKMVEGAFHIMEPSADAPIMPYDRIALAIVPGTKFDRNGNRKGHGCGYYDRLLPKLHCPIFGVAPADKIVDRIEVQPHDVPVDRVFSF